MSNECAICYATDINFLLPTLVSASLLRKFVSSDKADVLIFLVDQEQLEQELNKFLEPYAIRILSMNSKAYGGFDTEKFHNTGMPLSALARLFIDPLLPDSCRRIVYLDGDTWIKRNPSSLVEAIVPEGKFAAVDDMISFRSSKRFPPAHQLRSYFKGLGITPQNGYFNSGVFATSRKTWRTLAAEAFGFLAENPSVCTFHDQSALNAVIGDRRLRLSLKWNFQTPFQQLHMGERIDPCIYHFTRFPKPWMGPCEPWKMIYTPYQSALEPFKALNLPIKKLDESAIDAQNKISWQKNMLNKAPFMAKLAVMHLGIDTYEIRAWL